MKERERELCCCIVPIMAKTIQAIITICSLLLLLLLSATTSHPLCSDSSKCSCRFEFKCSLCSCRFDYFLVLLSETPVNNNETLQFCDSYKGKSCCNSKDDLQLQNRFNSMNISDSNCSSLLKSILCSVSLLNFLNNSKKPIKKESIFHLPICSV